MSQYNIVMEMPNSTVLAEYEPLQRKLDSYQSEAELEKEFIRMLTEQGYEYLEIHSEKALEENLRKQLELLNNYKFSDSEWTHFFKQSIANSNDNIAEKTRKIQEDSTQVLEKDDQLSRNIRLIDKKDIHNNRLQVINQYVENNGQYKNRYDVTILVNGFPLVHVELKRRGVALKEAFNQINRYQQESFWAGSGLFEYIQIFVISNGINTKYYSNTTRNSHIKEQNSARNNSKKTSNSFEFTSYWADAKNKIITDLIDFTRTFFAKHTLLHILTKYCVFTSENQLLVMRPYQIVATERILDRINSANNYKKMGSREAGGYIWHTTGSGKTLTSFKTAQLASKLDYIDKVLFVVDRKDLDYQTMKEYEKFSPGAANGNTSTKKLQTQLEDTTDSRIIVTTIQKLNKFVKSNPDHSVFKKHLVIIFDECHRSQFGDMHNNITKKFKNYHLFGFTGTPIFTDNAAHNSNFFTTEQVFGDKLHSYTIVDAINDGNVLPFRVDYINTFKSKDNILDQEVQSINTEEVLASPERIKNIVSYILEHFDQKTQRNSFYDLKGKRLNGFNSIFAVSSISMAKKYYLEFKKQLEEQQKDLTIATIFSCVENKESSSDGIIEDESFETDQLEPESKEFLNSVIAEYNKKFKTNYSSEEDSFQNYYKDLSKKVKEREIDLLIVVNMFLTGFDATTLNTLWVDKNLQQHGLIQAFSRTNRILNSVKSYGNIICFRDLQKQTDDAIALFGNKDAIGIVLLRPYEDYYNGYEDANGNKHKGYAEIIAELLQKYPLGTQIIGEQAPKDFIALVGTILKLKNVLSSFDQFKGNEILSERDFQDYLGTYADFYEEFKSKKVEKEKESIIDDIIFEMELVKQIEVNIDYILKLVSEYKSTNCKDQEIIVSITKAINSSLSLRSKKELIEQFIERVNAVNDVINEWTTFVKEQSEIDLQKLIQAEDLKPEKTRQFIKDSFRNGEVKTIGTAIGDLLPAMSFFAENKSDNRLEKKQIVTYKLLQFFEKYYGIL